MHAVRQRVAERREAVRAAVDAGAAGDPAAGDAGVREALRGLRRAQAELDSLAQEFLLEEFAVLTPEQRARYARLLPLEPWRGDGPGGGGAPLEGPRHGGGRRRAAE
jgi:Spy/CpxP family protein refolding chaperone